jgi:WD40 repeat protein
LIFPALAVQLARKYAQFRKTLVRLLQSDPETAHEPLFNQMRKMIVQPLKKSGISTVIIVDALDECTDEEPASAILSVLGQFVSEIPNVKFFITGRPEPCIREGFRLPLLAEATDVFVLHDIEPSQVDNDIRLFFTHGFSELALRRPGLDDWPTKEQLDLLCKRAAGLFVYAVATVKFIDKRSANPIERLNLLLRSPEGSGREARTKFNENTTLDSLYTSVLERAFGDDDDPDNDPKVRSVLGAMILAANPISSSSIAMLLDLDPHRDVFPLLSSAQSLLTLQDTNHPVQPFHRSFPDFIIDPDRCTNQRFYVSPHHHHSQLLIGCLNLLGRTLEKNMCKLPDGVANSDISDLKERTERYLDPTLRYACQSWHAHLVGGYGTSAYTSEITSALHRFLESKFLFWLEVLSVLGVVRNAVDALQAAADWLEVRRRSMLDGLQKFSDLIQQSPTLDLTNDCSRFVTRHFEIISTSSPHIYHSALVLTPRGSIVHKIYRLHSQPFVRVVRGVPALWDSNAAATIFPYTICAAEWSPCDRFIAVGWRDIMRADILDSVTLQQLQSLEFPPGVPPDSEALAFSPDSRMLTSFIRGNYHLDTGGFVVSWDLQTGSIASTIEWKGPRDTRVGIAHITYSMNGGVVAILSRYKSSTVISIYDIVSGVYMYNLDHHPRTNPVPSSRGLYVYEIWAHGESFRFATPEPMGITIWEVGSVPQATVVESVSVPYNAAQMFAFKPRKQTDIVWTEFNPASCRLAFICIGAEDTLLIWDARASKFLLHQTGTGFYPSMTFSSDGRFFACTTFESEVYLWKESPNGYTLFEKLTPSIRYSKPLLSPNGESIITLSDSTIQLWHTKSFSTTSGILAPALQYTGEDFVLEFLPDRSSAVYTRKKEKTVTVLDLKSGVPQLIIDTSIDVFGLRSIENSLVVIGDEKAIIWNLAGGNLLPDARMNVKDNTRTINFGNVDSSTVISASISLDFRYIALARYDGEEVFLDVYCTCTGWNIRGEATVYALWFAPGGHDIWCAADDEAKVYTVTQGALDLTKTVADVEDRSWECPWGSSRGYKVTYDGWILGASGKRLLMLPPLWQSFESVDRVWNGKFLALLHGSLPEPVILELEP